MSTDFVTEEDSDWSRDDWGVLVEQETCETYLARNVATDDSSPDWVDAVVEEVVVDDQGYVLAEEGTPIQAKATVWRSREFRSALDSYTTRRGRYFIGEHAHNSLLEAEGKYALGVYDPVLAGSNPIALTLVDAAEVDRLDLTWCSNGDGTEAARLRWSEIFDEETVKSRRDELAANMEESP